MKSFLLVGQTGAGKTMFCHSLKQYFNEELDFERSGKSSDTLSCKLHYFKELHVSLVDTPGLSDTRGMDQDMENIRLIIKQLIDVHVSSIIFVINGSTSRETESFIEFVSKYRSFLPPSLFDEVSIVVTHCSKVSANVNLQSFCNLLDISFHPPVFYINSLPKRQSVDKSEEKLFKIQGKMNEVEIKKFLEYLRNVKDTAPSKVPQQFLCLWDEISTSLKQILGIVKHAEYPLQISTKRDILHHIKHTCDCLQSLAKIMPRVNIQSLLNPEMCELRKEISFVSLSSDVFFLEGILAMVFKAVNNCQEIAHNAKVSLVPNKINSGVCFVNDDVAASSNGGMPCGPMILENNRELLSHPNHRLCSTSTMDAQQDESSRQHPSPYSAPHEGEDGVKSNGAESENCSELNGVCDLPVVRLCDCCRKMYERSCLKQNQLLFDFKTQLENLEEKRKVAFNLRNSEKYTHDALCTSRKQICLEFSERKNVLQQRQCSNTETREFLQQCQARMMCVGNFFETCLRVDVLRSDKLEGSIQSMTKDLELCRDILNRFFEARENIVDDLTCGSDIERESKRVQLDLKDHDEKLKDSESEILYLHKKITHFEKEILETETALNKAQHELRRMVSDEYMLNLENNCIKVHQNKVKKRNIFTDFHDLLGSIF
eukprot:GDKJ01050206.1.p1 GENE.GDKJ01050206.1~~GDKJ01050206.1.p1  ORF type:complete len:658 (-),score=58.80 GDKJ01050206.1:204-2177(-)